MKKVIAILIVTVLLFNVGVLALDSKAQVRISGLHIFDTIEDSGFLQSEYITRADMCVILVRLTMLDPSAFGKHATGFTDVSESHWASGYIYYANNMGLVRGRGDGTFAPDSTVSYEETVKTLISLLNYDVLAMERGGFPYGYMVVAGSLGLLNGVEVDGEPLTKDDIAAIVNNVLDVKPMYASDNSGSFKIDDVTLYEILTGREDLVKVKGIVTETALSGIAAVTPGVKEGYVMIGNVRYATEQDYSALLGYYVEGYAKEYDNDTYIITILTPSTLYNELIEVKAEDVTLYDTYAEIENNDGRRAERVDFDSLVTFVYNGRLVYRGKDICYGEYKFLDNTGDGNIDVVFIQEAESFVVERINKNNQAIYFADSQTLRGKNNFSFEDSNNYKNYWYLKNTDGDIIKFEDISVGDAVTFFASEDMTLITAVVSKERLAGEVTETTVNGEIYIDGEKYEAAYNSEGERLVEFNVGDKATYILDMFGNIAGIDGSKEYGYQFGYVMAAGAIGKSALSSDFGLKVVTAGKPKKEEVTKNDTTTISYYFCNDTAEIYKCNTKLKFNGNSIKSSNLNKSDLEGKIVGFKLNEQGLINEISTYDIPQLSTISKHSFNAKIVSFGGISRGYLTNAATQIICVPNVVRQEEDYYVELKITNGSTANKVFGVNAFPSTSSDIPVTAQPVDVLVIKADMNSSELLPIQEDADICIVGNVATMLGTVKDDMDEPVYKIEILNGEELLTLVTPSSGATYELASKLRKGDLIKYTTDWYGRAANIELVDSVQGLINYGETRNNGFYGLISDLKLFMYDYEVNAMVDKISVYYNDYLDNSIFNILREDGPPIYLYERSTGWIYPATGDDIMPGYSRVYVQCKSGVVEAAVIIKD